MQLVVAEPVALYVNTYGTSKVNYSDGRYFRNDFRHF